jgi:Flp pilus assembly protein TadG
MRLWRAVRGAAEAVLDRCDAAAGIPRAARESGAATVEFVILLPLFLVVFISTLESSIMLYRQVMLERGVDIATRDVRLDSQSIMGANELKQRICEEAKILNDCNTNLVVELQVVNDVTYAMPDSAQPCYNRATSTTPQNVAFATSNRAAQIMTLRACFAADPIMPTSGLGSQIVAELDGQSIRLVAATAFRVEPP